MSRRQILRALTVLLAVAAVGIGIQWLLSPKHRINKESIAQIKEGMTQKEVEDILGVPPGNYAYDGFFTSVGYSGPLGPGVERWPTLQWAGEEIGIRITINPHNGTVAEIEQFSVDYPTNESVLSKIKRWLRIPSTAPAPIITTIVG